VTLNSTTSRPLNSLLVLTNPGSRRAHEVRTELEQSLSELDPAPSVTWIDVISDQPESGAFDRVAIVGGDGSVNLALRWLDRADISAPVAIIPAGTGNNLARGLKIPTAAADSIALALHSSHSRRIDAVRYLLDGEVSGIMLQVAALGMPARVAMQFDRLRHKPLLRHPIRWLGDSFYRLLALVAMARGKNEQQQWRISVDGTDQDGCGSALFLGNEGTIGGGFHPCPRASLDDGLLDLCLIPPLTTVEAIRLFSKISRGKHLEARSDIFYIQCRKVRIEQSAAPFLVDGDIVGAPQEVELEVLPGHLDVILPEPWIE